MNNRIKELVEMAITQNEPDWPQFRKSLTGSGALYLHVFGEKFAELIVDECMMLCGAVSGAAQVSRPNDAFGDGAEKCKSLIKEHFGVEE